MSKKSSWQQNRMKLKWVAKQTSWNDIQVEAGLTTSPISAKTPQKTFNLYMIITPTFLAQLF